MPEKNTLRFCVGLIASICAVEVSSATVRVRELWRSAPFSGGGQLWFAPDGNYFGATDEDEVVVFNRRGNEVFRVESQNRVLPKGRGFAFDAEGKLLVWDSPNILKWVRLADGEEVRREEIVMGPKPEPDVQAESSAFFSPDGSWVAIGWNGSEERTVFETATMKPALRLNLRTESRFGASSVLQFNRERTRLHLFRIGVFSMMTYSSIYDLVEGRVFSDSYLFEYCPEISGDSVREITVVDPYYSEGREICRGELRADEMDTRFAHFSESGKFLFLRAGVFKIPGTEGLRVTKTVVNASGTEYPPVMFPNAGEREAFAVWEGLLIEGYDLELMDGAALFSMDIPWDEFKWFAGTPSPDGEMLVLQARIEGAWRLVAIENPLARPILKAPVFIGERMRLEWAGGKEPYRVFATDDLNGLDWEEIARPVAGVRWVETRMEGTARYYRVEGGNP